MFFNGTGSLSRAGGILRFATKHTTHFTSSGLIDHERKRVRKARLLTPLFPIDVVFSVLTGAFGAKHTVTVSMIDR